MELLTATYLLPEQLLCYFHYGDTDGLSNGDMEIVERWENSTRKIHGDFSIIDSDEKTRNFLEYHCLKQYGWGTDSCVEMRFKVEKE